MKITGLLIYLYRREIILAFHQYLIQHQDIMGFPGWLSGKESTSNAGDLSSILDTTRKVPHAVQQLSPFATTAKPVC